MKQTKKTIIFKNKIRKMKTIIIKYKITIKEIYLLDIKEKMNNKQLN